MKILMAYLTVKDASLRFILMHVGFGAPSVGDHDDLIGPLGLHFADMPHGCENVGGMASIHHVDG